MITSCLKSGVDNPQTLYKIAMIVTLCFHNIMHLTNCPPTSLLVDMLEETFDTTLYHTSIF